MAIDYTALGQRIADFRSKENLSQEELAFRCGVGNKHISNIELGKSKPSLESLVQIANFLNVSTEGSATYSRGCAPTCFLEMKGPSKCSPSTAAPSG